MVCPARWRDLLREICLCLNDAGVCYCVLREPLSDRGDENDIDFLVGSDQLVLFYRTLAHRYCVTGPHRIQTHYHFGVGDKSSGASITLDVSTHLFYGESGGVFRVPHEKTILQRRQYRNGTWYPHPIDQLISLTLHALLDKRDVHTERIKDLQELSEQLKGDSLVLTAEMDAWFGNVRIGVMQALQNGDVGELRRARRAVQRELFRRDPLGVISNYIRSQVRGREYLHCWPILRPMTVALIGPDGVGKTTLGKDLAREADVKYVYMGGNGALLPSTKIINLFAKTSSSGAASKWDASVRQPRVKGAIGSIINGIKDFTSRPIIELNTWLELLARYVWAMLGSSRCLLIVFDRYVYERIVHVDDSEMQGRGAFKRLLWHLCVRVFPQPDAIILLRAPAAVLLARKQEHEAETLERFESCARYFLDGGFLSSRVAMHEVQTDEAYDKTLLQLKDIISIDRLTMLESKGEIR